MKKLTMVLLAGLMALAFAGCDRKDQGSQEQHDASADEPKSVVTPIEEDVAAPVKEEDAAPVKDDAAKDANGKDEANGAKAAAENDKVGSE